MRNSRRFRNRNGMRRVAELASDRPEPIRIGATMIRSSSSIPSSMRLVVSTELPRTSWFLLSSRNCFGSLTTLVLCQAGSGLARLRETTTLGASFMRDAISGSLLIASSLGQYCAIPS